MNNSNSSSPEMNDIVDADYEYLRIFGLMDKTLESLIEMTDKRKYHNFLLISLGFYRHNYQEMNEYFGVERSDDMFWMFFYGAIYNIAISYNVDMSLFGKAMGDINICRFYDLEDLNPNIQKMYTIGTGIDIFGRIDPSLMPFLSTK